LGVYYCPYWVVVFQNNSFLRNIPFTSLIEGPQEALYSFAGVNYLIFAF